jgi:proteic killer suppression protein
VKEAGASFGQDLRRLEAPAPVDERTVSRYVPTVIRSFADKRTAALFAGFVVKALPSQIQGRARAKLLVIDAAKQLDDLRVPPGNRLEALHGDRRGQYSIRINDQWRLCFEWREDAAWNVEVVDYHKG